MGNFIKNKWRKVLASFLAFVMTFQAVSGVLDLTAYEMKKVNLAPTVGKYKDKELCSSQLLNKDKLTVKESVIKKDPVIYNQESTYDESLEVKEKRTENSKTYKLSNGTYVQETYFEPIHKKDGKEFIEIDNNLENISKARSLPIYENKDGYYSFKVQDKTMSIETNEKQVLKVINNSAKLDVYNVKDNVILYSEAYKNIDMEYRLGGNAVTTNFYINGTTNQDKIIYQIDKGNLELKEDNDTLLFLDNNKTIFSYTKPYLYDSKGNLNPIEFDYEQKDNIITITLDLDTTWINSNERIYPVMMSSRAADEDPKLQITSAYNRSKDPNTTSQYYHLYVGYDDGASSGFGGGFGIARTYIHVAGLDIGPDKLILSAELQLYKLREYKDQWNTISIGKTSSYINPSDATWNNRPAVTNISSETIGSKPDWQSFDIKSYMEDIYKGKNNTLELKASDESSKYTPNVFSAESGTGLPKITLEYKDDYNVNPSLPIDTFDSEMRIFSVLNQGFEAFSFDGIAKPNTKIIFDLVERGKNDVVVSESANVNRYFVNPIYVIKQIANTQTYPKGEINYTTDYIYKSRIPKFDTPYEYKVKVQASSTTSIKEYRTDSFTKYKVKAGDNLKNIAAYYGIEINDIKTDNNLNTNIIKEDDILLLRFKKNNDKVSKDIYTPPVRSVTYKAEYVNRGPRCYNGTCEIIDPVNATTGNYYYEGVDFTIKDAEDFNFTRYYNSTGPKLSNLFGNGFTTPIESYISYDKNGNIIYFGGDGKIFEFEKTSSGYRSRSQDKMSISVSGEKVTIKDLITLSTYQFDVYGYLETITSKEGTVTRINYDTYGLITSIQVGNKTLSLTYNENKLVKDITLPDGNKVNYKYDNNRNLIEFIDTRGSIKKYNYDSNKYLTSIVDKNGYVVTQNTYDSTGRVTKQIDGNNNSSTINYENQKTTITHSDKSVEVYTFNSEYDVLSITQNGKVTSAYTYDQYRNITSMTDEDGNVTKYMYSKQNLLKTEYPDGTYEEYKYDSLNNVIYQRDKEGKITENTYSGYDLTSTKDSQNILIQYTYDDKRRVIKETDQFGVYKSYTYAGNMISSITHSNGLIEYFEYDTNGNIVKERDNQGKLNTYIYNVNNLVTQKNYSDGTNEQWTYDANGNIKTYKDRIGGLSTNTYDKNNNLIKTVKGNITTSKQYNELNQVISETDEQGLKNLYTYDVYGNKKTETDAYGHITTYQYDIDGNVIKTTNSLGKEEINEYKDGNPIKTIDKFGLVTSYEYDSLNREVKKTNPNGTIETKEYDGLLLTKEVDSKGTIIQHIYDKYAREIKTITTYADEVISTSEKEYDVYGNVVETNIDGVITKNTYDVYKQLISTTDDLNHTTKKVYDLDGNVIKEIDALNNSTITKYDGNKNIISITDKNGHTSTKKYNANGQLISEEDALGYVKTYSYNNKGQLIEVIDPYKNKITYTYDQYGKQLEAKLEDKVIEKKEYDEYGRETYAQTLDSRITTKYDDFDRKISNTNELTGLKIDYIYDDYGNIIKEQDSEGLLKTYVYDKYNRKIESIDGYDRKEELIYNIRDQVIETKAFDGTTTHSKYNQTGQLIETTDALGKVTKNTYNSLNQLIKEESGDKITEYVYNANGQQIEVKNINNETSTKTVYDKNGNVIESIDVDGNSTKTEYDANNQAIATIDAANNRSTKEYDAYGNVIKEINALGDSKQTKYNKYGLKEIEVDERGFDITYEYNDDLMLSKIIDSKDNTLTVEYNDKLQKVKEVNANDGITEYEYDAYGREVKVIEPNGKEIIKDYDKLGNVVKEENGQKITENHYDELGRLVKTVLNDVIQVQNTYNDYNQVIETLDANKNKSTYQYNINGNVIYSDEKGFISEKEYDVYSNLIKQVDNKTYITTNTYNNSHKLTDTKVNDKTTLHKEYDKIGNEVVIIENGVETRREYDKVNRLIKVEVPSSSKDEFVTIQAIEYDATGNPIRITDGNGNVEEKKFDANNNVIEEINKNGVQTLYEYDALNNVIKVQNHKERYVSYTYDKSNNLTLKNINGKYAENKYDEDNQLIYEENEYGYKYEYEYDEFGHKIEEVQPNGNKIKYTYDSLGNKLSENEKLYSYDSRNNVLTSSNDKGTVKNTYDAFNNKTSVTDTNNQTVSYLFDNNNKVSEKEYAGIKVQYNYNDYGLIKEIKKDDKTIAEYEYNQRNEIIKLKQVNTLTEKTYDNMGRIINQVSKKDNHAIINTSYTYDPNDNMIKEVVDGKENTYKYDEYDELVESHKYINDKIVETKYQHDVFGNQIEKNSLDGTKTYKYNDKNQIESIDTDKGIIKYSYDDNGNVEEKINDNKRIDTYEYDEFNQLTQLIQGKYIYDYTYDAENERIKQVRTDTMDYHYDEWYNYTVDYDVVGDKQIEDSFEKLRQQADKKQTNGNLCSSILSDKYDRIYNYKPEVTEYTLDRNVEYTEVLQENDTVHIYGDTLLQSDDNDIVTGLNNSVIARVSEDVKKITYSDYGNTEDIVKGHGYNSEMMDSSGLIYLRARYYDPGISRFVQIDTKYNGEKESIASQNKYVYTLNNPYKYVDRNGNWAVGVLGIIPSIKNPYTLPPNKNNIGVVGGTTLGGASLRGITSVPKKKPKPIPIPPTVRKSTGTKKPTLPKVETGIGKNKPSTKGGGSVAKKPVPRNIVIAAACPEKEPDIGSKALDVLQKVLDLIGWIPGLGDICDGINAAISFFRNDFVGAIISVTCMVFTVVADALLKPLKNSKLVQKVVQVIKDKFGSGVSKIADSIGSIAKKIKKVPFIGKLLDGATKALNQFKGYINDLFEKISNSFISAKNKILDRFKNKTSSSLYFKLDLQMFAKKDIKMVSDAAREVGVDRDLFGEFIHEIKDELGKKASDNFTYQELIELARELKGSIRK